MTNVTGTTATTTGSTKAMTNTETIAAIGMTTEITKAGTIRTTRMRTGIPTTTVSGPGGLIQIGRASCRERVWISGVAGSLRKRRRRRAERSQKLSSRSGDNTDRQRAQH